MASMSLTSSSSQFNHDLIDAYQQCQVLYDCENINYKAPAPTRECWAFVAEKCGSTSHECRVRWKALRDRYIKERKRRMLTTFDPTKKSWPLYNRMDFLDEYVEKQRQKFPRNGISKENQFKIKIIEKMNSTGDESMPMDGSNFISNCYEESFVERSNDILSTNFQILKAIEDSGIKIDQDINNISETFLNIANSTTSVEENVSAANCAHTATLANYTNTLSSAIPSFQRRQTAVDNMPVLIQNASSTSHDTIEALRVTAEALSNVTQTIFSKDAEGSFGEFVASMLRIMPPLNRSIVMKQIFEVLNLSNGNSTTPVVNNL